MTIRGMGRIPVTICTDWREHLFGTVTDGRMEVNAAGRAVERVWQGLPEHYPHVELDVFVVMPNHVHGIVVLVGGEAESESGPTVGSVTGGSRAEEAVGNGPYEEGRSTAAWVVGGGAGFKTYSGRRVNEVRGTPGTAVWQRGYYEHVVRNDEDMNRIRQYFQENPLRWSLKRENWGVEGRGSGESG